MTEEIASSSPNLGRPDTIPKVLIKQASDSDQDKSHQDTEESSAIPNQNGHNDDSQQTNVEASPETGESTSAVNNNDSTVNDRPISAAASADEHEKKTNTEELKLMNESFDDEALLLDKDVMLNADELMVNEVKDGHDQTMVKKQEGKEETEDDLPKTAGEMKEAKLQSGTDQIVDIASSETNRETLLLRATDEQSADEHKYENVHKPTENDSEIESISNMVDENAASDTEKAHDNEVIEENVKHAKVLNSKDESVNEDEDFTSETKNINEIMQPLSIKSKTEETTQPENTSVSSEEKIEGMNHFDPYDASVSGNEDDTPEKHFDTSNAIPDKLGENLSTANEPKSMIEDIQATEVQAEDSHENDSKTEKTQLLTTVDVSEQNEWVDNTSHIENETKLNDPDNDALLAAEITMQEKQLQATSDVRPRKSPFPAPGSKSVRIQTPPDDSNRDFDATSESPAQPLPENEENESKTNIPQRPTTPAIMKSVDLQEISGNERPRTPEEPPEVVVEVEQIEENEVFETLESKEEVEHVIKNDEWEDKIKYEALQKEMENMKRIKEEENEVNEKNIQKLNDEIRRLKEENAEHSQNVDQMNSEIRRLENENRESIKTLENRLTQLREENAGYKEDLAKRERQLNGTTQTVSAQQQPKQEKSKVCNIL